MKKINVGLADASDISRITRLLMAALPPFRLLNVVTDGSCAYVFCDDQEERDPKAYLDAHPEDPKVIFNIITAVSREYNISRMLHDLETGLAEVESLAHVNWILIFDAPGPKKPYTEKVVESAKLVKIVKGLYSGEHLRYGIQQKNMGFDLADEHGYCTIIDDDNVIHPNFLKRMTGIIRRAPRKRAFIYSQKRWDISSLRGSMDMLKPCGVDNTQCLVHKSLIGANRHDPTKSGLEDYYFIKAIFDSAPDEFVFIEEVLALYNYLHVAKGAITKY